MAERLPLIGTLAARRCAFVMANGAGCRAAPLHEGTYCLLHDPDHAEEVARARRAGGSRRRRESTLELAFDLQGLDSVAGIRRLLTIVVADALAADPGIARLRVILAAIGSATKLLEVADLTVRVEALEHVHRMAERGEGTAGRPSGPAYSPESDSEGSLLGGRR